MNADTINVKHLRQNSFSKLVSKISRSRFCPVKPYALGGENLDRGVDRNGGIWPLRLNADRVLNNIHPL